MARMPLYNLMMRRAISKKRKAAMLEEHNRQLKRKGLGHLDSLTAKAIDRQAEPFRPLKATPAVPAWRTDTTRSIPSRINAPDAALTAKPSLMDTLHTEPEAVREAILRKSRSLAPAYNKGAYQYVTEETDPCDIGRKK